MLYQVNDLLLILLVCIFVSWLYTQRFPKHEPDLSSLETDSDLHKWRANLQISLIRAYIFGDRFLAPRFTQGAQQNLVFWLFKRHWVYYSTVIFAYASLEKYHVILKALVAAHCSDYRQKEDDEDNGQLQLRSQLPVQFLFDVQDRFSELSVDQEPLNRCDYHEHGSKKDKDACREKLSYEDTDSDSD